jgi:hypothetical protein
LHFAWVSQPCRYLADEGVKIQNPGGFEKNAKLRRANLSGVRRTYGTPQRLRDAAQRRNCPFCGTVIAGRRQLKQRDVPSRIIRQDLGKLGMAKGHISGLVAFQFTVWANAAIQ